MTCAAHPTIRTLSRLALAGGLSLSASTVVLACGPEDYVGTVCYTISNYCPQDYLHAEGQILEVSEYPALFSLVSNTYGGDGRTTFGIPDLRGRTPVGYGVAPGLSAIAYGQVRGAETAELGLNQLPAHNHVVNSTGGSSADVQAAVPVATGTGNISTVSNGQTVYPAGLNIIDGDSNITYSGPYTNTEPTVSQGAIPVSVSGKVEIKGLSTEITGGGQAFDVIPPQVGVSACIMVNGIYPPRP